MTLTADGRTARATGVRLTRCPCRPPPWSLTARAVRLDADGDLWLRGPTLRLGRVPVFWLPGLWLRTTRRPGLLPPRLEWRGPEGLLAGLDATLPLGDLDVDLGAALRTAGPAEARARLAADGLAAEATARTDGLQSTGQLVQPGLGARWDLTSRSALRARLASTVAAATERPRPLQAWATAEGPLVGLAAGIDARQTEADGALTLDGAFPSLVAWTSPLVLAPRLFADATLQVERRLATDLLRAALSPRLVGGLPVGPLRLSAAALARATGARGPTLARGTTARLAAGGATAASAPLERRWGALVHELEPRLAASWAGLAVDEGPAAGLVQDPDAVVAGPRAEASLASRVRDAAGEVPVEVEAGALVGDRDLRVAFVVTRLATAHAQLEATVAADLRTREVTSWVNGGVDTGLLSLGLGHAHLAAGRSLLTDARPRVGELPLVTLPVGAADLAVLHAGLHLASIADVTGRAWTDLDARRLVAAEVSVVHRARCGCLTLGLAGAIWQGRALPEVRAIVQVP